MSDVSDLRRKYRAVALLVVLGAVIALISGSSGLLVTGLGFLAGVLLVYSWNSWKSGFWKILP